MKLPRMHAYAVRDTREARGTRVLGPALSSNEKKSLAQSMPVFKRGALILAERKCYIGTHEGACSLLRQPDPMTGQSPCPLTLVQAGFHTHPLHPLQYKQGHISSDT